MSSTWRACGYSTSAFISMIQLATRSASLVNYLGTEQGLSDVLDVRWWLIGIISKVPLKQIFGVLLPVVKFIDILNVLLLDLDVMLLASPCRLAAWLDNWRHFALLIAIKVGAHLVTLVLDLFGSSNDLLGQRLCLIVLGYLNQGINILL